MGRKKGSFMKMAWILIGILLLFTGCGHEKTAGSTEAPGAETEIPEETVYVFKPGEDFSEQRFMEEIQIHLTALYECDQETYFAQVLWDEVYLTAGHMEGYEFVPEVIYREGDPMPEGYEEDPAFASYFRTMNIGTIQNARQNLSFYMTEEMVEKLFKPEDFFETEEGLYLCRGPRGYGSTLCVPESARYLGEENGEQLVAVDYNYFGEYDYTAVVHFTDTETGWKISRVEEPGT